MDPTSAYSSLVSILDLMHVAIWVLLKKTSKLELPHPACEWNHSYDRAIRSHLTDLEV